MNLDQPLRGAPFMAFDFETCGLRENARWPVSVALVSGELGRPKTHKVEWSSLVKPWNVHCDHIPQEAVEVHGITADMLTDAPDIADMLERVLALLEGRVPMAYNLPYDWGVLSDCMRLCGAKPLELVGLDPLPWAKVVDRSVKGKGRHKLSAVCARRGIEFLAHDSKNDVLATAEVAPRLLAEMRRDRLLPEEALDSLGAFWAWQKEAALADEKRFRSWLLRQPEPPSTVSCPWHDLLGVDVEAKRS